MRNFFCVGSGSRRDAGRPEDDNVASNPYPRQPVEEATTVEEATPVEELTPVEQPHAGRYFCRVSASG